MMKSIINIIFMFFSYYLLADNNINWPHVVEDLIQYPEKHQLTPMPGGASNKNYRFNLDGEYYFMRISPDQNEWLYSDISIENEVLCLFKDKIGCCAHPLYFDEKNKILI